MMLEDMAVTIDNKKYVVMENVEYENKKYVYLVNEEDLLDTLFQEINLEDQSLKPIETGLFVNTIFPLFKEKFDSYE